MLRVLQTLILVSGAFALKFTNHGYEDVLVTISPDVPPTEALTTIANIESWLKEGSDVLYQSSRRWAYIRSVKILIPATWTDISATSVDGIVYEDGDIRVNTKSGVYGNSPFTVQTGGCGDPGEYIQLSDELFSRLTYGKLNETYGPPGQVFVHEWAKYRYGVFEEHGYPGDEKYPMFYYKAEWTSEGQKNTILPTFCTDAASVNYKMENMFTGGSCGTDQNTGMPDKNCIPVLDKNNTIKSSIMAIPYLDGNVQFCDDQETYIHRSDIPTKHNDMCQGRSTFNVIKSHPDFVGYNPNNKIPDTTTYFEILRPAASSSFVMVLDASLSMSDNCKNNPNPNCQVRLNRMKQSVKRWLTYDVDNGIPLGVVHFNRNPTTLLPLTVIDDKVRKDTIEKVDKLNTGSYTCLGSALRGGLKVLTDGNVKHGGVMLFLTDGEFACQDGETISKVLPDVVKQGVRVIAVAFSDKADKEIIKLAEQTNGKAYFIPDDSGPEVINTALQASLTYQPSVKSTEADVIIFEKTFRSMKNFSVDVQIDKMLGKNVTVQIDFTGNPGSKIMLLDNTGKSFNTSDGVFQHTDPALEPGSYGLTVNTFNGKPISFASVKVTSRARGETIPITTRCWTNVGNSKADLSNSNQKIAVIAEVLQGVNPVIGARVIANIEREGVPEPLTFQLLDTGSEPDNVADDGLYARYFTNFDPNKDLTRYTLKCQVEGTDDSNINQGFLNTRHSQKSLPSHPTAGSPICCGSSTLRSDSSIYPTGDFSRSTAGGLIEVLNANNVKYPPGRITNLRGTENQNPNYFGLSFTSPGLVLDSGIANGMRVYYTLNSTLLTDQDQIINNLPFLVPEDVQNGGSLAAQEAGTQISIRILRDKFDYGKQYFFRIVTFGDSFKTWSNIARVFIQTPSQSAGVSLHCTAVLWLISLVSFLITH